MPDWIRTAVSELEPSPLRWRRAAQVAFVTAFGAGVMGALQIVNPLGLTLLLSFAAPETVFDLGTAVCFLLLAALMQVLMLVVAGALATAPLLQLLVFAGYAAATTYVIYGLPRFGRLWVWVQIPTATAFYLVIFQHDSLGGDNLEGFVGMAVATALALCFNHLIWPRSAAQALEESLVAYLGRSRRRLAAAVPGHLAEGDFRGRPTASRLGSHVELLKLAARKPAAGRSPWSLLSAVLRAERIHRRVEQTALMSAQAGEMELNAAQRVRLGNVVAGIEAGIAHLAGNLPGLAADHQRQPAAMAATRAELAALQAELAASPAAPDRVMPHLLTILRELCDLLEVDGRELPHPLAAWTVPAGGPPRPGLNRFLVRFSLRHTLAMTIAFVAGLIDNTAAMHAALWLLMIGGPPSHGATVRKFTMRAVGAGGAMVFAALATLVLAPNFTGPASYMAVLFAVLILITYVGEGAGLLSFLSIGATAFVIAFSAPGPRTEITGSVWTIWGISFGMLIRAGVSLAWPEYAPRTLVEEFEAPFAALARLVPGADGETTDPEAIAMYEAGVMRGIEELLGVAVDAQLEGGNPDIDPDNLVDSLDTLHRLAWALGNLRRRTAANQATRAGISACDRFDVTLRKRLETWCMTLRVQKDAYRMERAPLRAMVQNRNVPRLFRPLREVMRVGDGARASQIGLGDDGNEAGGAPAASYRHVARLLAMLQRQLCVVSRH